MFNRISAFSLPELAKYLGENIALTPLENPFTKHWVVVQNKEQQQWLSLQLAQLKGISANLQFLLPSELEWKLFRTTHADVPKQLPSDRLAMQWLLVSLLKREADTLFQFGLDPVVSVKDRVHFSAQIADVFDLYQMFRPEMLHKWASGDFYGVPTPFNWQPYLWQQMKLFWKELYPSIPTRDEVHKLLHTEIQKQPIIQPEHLHVFGLSLWSKPFADLIQRLSLNSEIHFYDLDYEFSEEGSPLVSQLFSWLNPRTEAESLLPIKIRNSHSESIDVHVQQLEIAIHSCHNAKREVEVLKNELLTKLDQNDTLCVSDVLIMVPDIELYGPLIEQIFLHRQGEPTIPLYLPSGSNKNSIPEVLLQTLKFLGRQQKVSLFIELLEHPIIQQKWGFNSTEIIRFKHWLADLSTHWGLAAEDSRFSLERALHHLFAGFSLEVESFETVGHLVPFGNIHGVDNLGLVARMSSFIHFLIEKRNQLNQEKSIIDWLKLMIDWSKGLEVADISKGMETNQKLLDDVQYSANEELISLDIFTEWYHQQLKDQSAQASRIGSGVVVSSYIPYRNIPFKMMAILGFNESVFPRNPFRPSFDLIAKQPLPGERLTKTDDALLFVERLVATSESVYLSYIGEGVNASLPSVSLQQLTEALPKNHFSKFCHKLHTFDEMDSNKFSNYAAQLAAAQAELELAIILPESNYSYTLLENESPKISMGDLISFFTNPCKYLAKNVLDISKVYEKELPSDREIFQLSGLEKYMVKDKVLEAKSMDVSMSQLQDYLYKKGKLPEGISGFDNFAEIVAQIDLLIAEVRLFGEESEAMENIELPVGDAVLTGTLNTLYGSKLIQWRIGSLKPKHYLELWVNHLVANAVSTVAIESHYFGIKRNDYKKQDEVESFSLKPVENPIDYLTELVGFFSNEHLILELAAMNPSCAHAYVSVLEKGTQFAEDAANDVWKGSNKTRGEAADFYNQWFWKQENPIEYPPFIKNATDVWSPLLAHIKGVER